MKRNYHGKDGAVLPELIVVKRRPIARDPKIFVPGALEMSRNVTFVEYVNGVTFLIKTWLTLMQNRILFSPVQVEFSFPAYVHLFIMYGHALFCAGGDFFLGAAVERTGYIRVNCMRIRGLMKCPNFNTIRNDILGNKSFAV